MTRIFVGSIVVFAMSWLSCASPPSDATRQSPEEVKRELMQLERRLIVAVQRKDMDTLNQIWAEDYFGTAIGRTVRKRDLMAAVEGGAIEIEALDADDLYVRLFGNGDVAVMTGHAAVRAKVSGEDYGGSYRGTGIFVKRRGRWEIAGVQVGPDRRPRPEELGKSSEPRPMKGTK